MTTVAHERKTEGREGRVGEVFRAFLVLGLTSFGGPVAHLGYFRQAFVERRRWLDEAAYADLVALCQFLPGPASSQVGFALGYGRAGLAGAVAAFVAFTLPSALVLFAVALGAAHLDTPLAASVVASLKILAVAVVAQAVRGMAPSLAPDKRRAGIALGAFALCALWPGAPAQAGAIVAGGALGWWLCREDAPPAPARSVGRASRRTGLAALALLVLLALGLPLLAALTGSAGVRVFEGFFRAGAFVFGGGHVVLPLLEAETVRSGWVAPDAFLAGYGAAQLVPGPLFTFASYLGALAPAPGGAIGALLATLAIFLPGLLLVLAALPFWESLRAKPAARAALNGANAAVVGLLGAALYDPVWTHAVASPRDAVLAVAAFFLLTLWGRPVWQVALLVVAAGFLVPQPT